MSIFFSQGKDIIRIVITQHHSGLVSKYLNDWLTDVLTAYRNAVIVIRNNLHVCYRVVEYYFVLACVHDKVWRSNKRN